MNVQTARDELRAPPAVRWTHIGGALALLLLVAVTLSTLID